MVSVHADWPKDMTLGGYRKMDRDHHSLKQLTVAGPIYNVELQNKTFSMVSEMMDAQDNNVGKIEVVLAFDTLIAPAMKDPWWRIYKADLIDMNGNVLISTINEKNKLDNEDVAAFGNAGKIEGETLAPLKKLEGKTFSALKKNESGTIFGPERPPEEISGSLSA